MLHKSKSFKDGLTSIFNRLTIRMVLISGFGLVVALGILMVLLTELTKNQAVDALNRFIGVDNQISDLCLRSITAMSNARRYEKEFILSYKDFGFNEAKSRYISRVLTSVDDIRESMKKIRLLGDHDVDHQTMEVDRAIVEYRDRLLVVVEKYGKTGAYNSGLEGALRDVALDMEAVLNLHGNDKLVGDLLSIRRKEKDFIMRNHDSDLAGLRQAVDRFKTDTAQSGLPRDLKKKLGTLTVSYQAMFEEYAKTMEEIRTVKSGYLNSVQVIEPALEKLYASSEIKAKESLDTIKKGQRVFNLVKTGAAVFALLMALAVSSTVYWMISKRVDKSKFFAEQVAGGNLAIRLATQGNNEFTALDLALNGMAESLNIAALARTKWTEELLKSEKEVRTLNQELEQKVAEKTKQLLDAQEELVRKEKLSILGQLSGSVGHELRNPLGVMSNAVYFLKMVLSDADETTKEYLDIIKKEIDTSLRIITDLLDFARTRPPQIKAVTARELTDESTGRCVIPDNVDLQSEITDNLPLLMVDPLQMGQVLQNLVMNAVQAMPDGGALRISARCAQGPGNRNQETGTGEQGSGEAPTTDPRFPIPDTSFIEISVTDTGEGINPENMNKKLFQPLFTTKPKGIGLGLVVCKNLVEANGGRIEVESELGKGTTFTVALPMERSNI